MARSEKTTIVLADTSVLVNLAFVDRFDLLGALRRFHFQVPEEVVLEITRPKQQGLLQHAIRAGHIETTKLTGIEALDELRRLRTEVGLGSGEAACLALAQAMGGMVASDEKRVFRREARHLLGERRLLDTPGLFVLAIRERYWTTAEADQAKLVLEGHRFRMRFASFDELIKQKGN